MKKFSVVIFEGLGDLSDGISLASKYSLTQLHGGLSFSPVSSLPLYLCPSTYLAILCVRYRRMRRKSVPSPLPRMRVSCPGTAFDTNGWHGSYMALWEVSGGAK
eukprot:TRINITY_DN11368_c0_g1_i2.p4 TRINITY_DN11368_c0_g1~~TRINITY_DN11368_c0_g1_i2.p4  ORF type:complete len:104 (+),score=6.89 TRINITY_DN11368_c0_g1_i2:92-403(+)